MVTDWQWPLYMDILGMDIVTMIMTIRMALSRQAFLRAPRAVAPRGAEIKLDSGSDQLTLPLSPVPDVLHLSRVTLVEVLY